MLRTRRSPKLVAALIAAMGAASIAPARAAEPVDCPNHGVLLDAAALCVGPQAIAVRADVSPTLLGRLMERGVRMPVADTGAAPNDAQRRRVGTMADDAAAAHSAPPPRATVRKAD